MEGLPETVGVSVAFEMGGGTAFVTPVPNLPEFKICNAQCACQKKCPKGTAKAVAASHSKEIRKYLLYLRRRGTGSAFGCGCLNRRSGALRRGRGKLLF